MLLGEKVCREGGREFMGFGDCLILSLSLSLSLRIHRSEALLLTLSLSLSLRSTEERREEKRREEERDMVLHLSSSPLGPPASSGPSLCVSLSFLACVLGWVAMESDDTHLFAPKP